MLLDLLRDGGWEIGKDDAGDIFCLKDMGNRIVQIFPSIKERHNHYRVSLSPSVSTRAFSNVLREISPLVSEFSPIIVSNMPVSKPTSISPGTLNEIINSAYAWAKDQDIDAGINSLVDLPTNSKGAYPLRHLGALAVTGNARKLDEYLLAFDTGDRLGFVNYITKDMIDRAARIAMKYAQ